MRVLVTGANGFVGRAVAKRLAAEQIDSRLCVRTKCDSYRPADDVVYIGDIDSADWSTVLPGCDAVIHTAARVHMMNERPSEGRAEFLRVNAAATLRLADAASAAGVTRFVFVSSVKVNGERSEPDAPFKESDEPCPKDAYGESKLAAEHALKRFTKDSGMAVSIVRSPLVYGPGVKANFGALIKLIDTGLPLPFGALTFNKRSLVCVENLADLLVTCATHPRAEGEIFFAGDGEDLSTAELARRLGTALERNAKLIAIPPGILIAAASAIGKAESVRRLVESLQVDVSKAEQLLDWKPPVSVDEGFSSTIKYYRTNEKTI